MIYWHLPFYRFWIKVKDISLDGQKRTSLSLNIDCDKNWKEMRVKFIAPCPLFIICLSILN